MATRRIPDPKIGGSIPSEVIRFFFLVFLICLQQGKKVLATGRI
jgi:hypothetical protein